MKEERLGMLMVAMLPGDEINFMGEVVGIADQPTLYFKAEGDDCPKHWMAHICRPATKDEQIQYWRDRTLQDHWDGTTERRSGPDRRCTYGRREVDSR